VSDWWIKTLPPSRRDWGEAYLSEFGAGSGLLRLTFTAWYLELKGGNVVRTVVRTTSVVNVIFGLFMASLLLSGPNPPLLAITAVCVIIQGTYTLWFASRSASAHRASARTLLLAGETVALLIGLGGFVGAFLNSAGASVDPEYGPITVAGLITAQAAATLYLYAIRNGSPADTARPQT
jgi:hypothetical protein